MERDFRVAAVIGGLIPIPLSLVVSGLELSRSVGLAFAVAASTLCPLLVLGIWWRGLTAAGAGCQGRGEWQAESFCVITGWVFPVEGS